MNANLRAGCLAIVIVAISIPTIARQSRAGPDRLGETFSGRRFDRHTWMMESFPPGGQFDISNDSLHLLIPPGGLGRPPASLKGRFGLEGNFALRVDFSLDRWPAPMAEWTNLEIEIGGDDGRAAIIRTRHVDHGDGYVAWSQRKDPASDGLWRQVPTSASSGTLRLVRKGAVLSFWAADPGSEQQLLDITEFGTSRVDSVAFRVTVPAIRGAVEARIDNITVEADRIVVEPRLPDPPPRRWDGAGPTIALLVTLAAAGFCYLGAASALPPLAQILPRTAGPAPGGPQRSALLVSMACGIVSVGVFLRVDGLDHKNMSGDEVATARRASPSSPGRTLDGIDDRRFPPLYDLVAREWTAIWGTGDAQIRGLSAALGLLAIPVISTIWGSFLGRRSGLWALSLLSVSALHVLFSQNARVDSAVWLLSAISCGSMLHLWLRSPRRWLWLWAYVTSSACLPMVGPSGVVPLAAQALYVAGWAFAGRPRVSRVVALALASAVALIASAGRLPQAGGVAEAFARVARQVGPGLAEIPAGILRLISALGTGSFPPERVPGPSLMEWALVAAQIMSMVIAVWLAASTLIAALRGKPGGADTGPGPDIRPAVVAFLGVWSIAPLLAALAISSGASSLDGVSWLLPGVAPGALLWVAAGLGSRGRHHSMMILGSILLGTNLFTIWIDRHLKDREPWREIAIAISQAASAVDLSVPGTARDLIVAWPGDLPFDEACLRHAYEDLGGSDMRLYCMPMSDALKSGMPFVVVAIDDRPPPVGGPPYRAAPSPERCSSRLIYASKAFNGRSTPVLDPFHARGANVWACEVMPKQSRANGP